MAHEAARLRAWFLSCADAASGMAASAAAAMRAIRMTFLPGGDR
jgi:CTP:molybdopterin cytidylyltransferase MocA